MKEILNLDPFWQITASSGLILSLLENVKIRIKTKLLRKQAWYFFTLILTFFFRILGITSIRPLNILITFSLCSVVLNSFNDLFSFYFAVDFFFRK